MKETWKDILGYEGLYQVSNLGRVKSLSKLKINGQFTHITKEKILININNKTGYLQVNLTRNTQKVFSVHRLVAQAFIPNPENKPQTNHKDGNKKNNHIDNLEWATVSENGIHSYRVLGNVAWQKGGRGEKMPTS